MGPRPHPALGQTPFSDFAATGRVSRPGRWRRHGTVLHNLFQFGFAGLAGICLLGAFLRRAHRVSFFAAAICAGSAAFAAHYDVFWALAVFGMGTLWALFCATNFIDLAWRAKVGFVLFLALGAGICIYPTYYDERVRAENDAAQGQLERATTPEEKAEAT